MVIKISKADKVEGVVAYNMIKVAQGEAELLDSHLVSVTYDDNGVVQMDPIIRSFKSRTDKVTNKRFTKVMTHISLNPDTDDNVTDEELVEMGKKLLDGLGYGEQPYIMVKHTDIDRHHLHIVVSNVDKNGKRLNKDHEHYRCNRIRKQIEYQFKLRHAEEARVRERKRKMQESKTDLLRTQLEALQNTYKASSFGAFSTLAELQGINIHETVDAEKGETTGLSYALMDEDHNNTMPWVAGQELGTGFTKKGMEEYINANKEWINRHCHRSGFRKVIQNLCALTTVEELNKQAEKLNMTILLRTSKTGKVLGVTIVDHKNRIVVNGSEVGRNLSARNWKVAADLDLKPKQLYVFGKQKVEMDSIIFPELERIKRNEQSRTRRADYRAGRTATTDRESPAPDATASRSGHSTRNTPLTSTRVPSLMDPSSGRHRQNDKANTSWHSSEEFEEEMEEIRKRKKQYDFYA